jgi:ribosomal protein S27AE
MVSPVHVAAILAALGKRRRCKKCGALQIVDALDDQGRYHCKKCGHLFSQSELKQSP